MLDSSRRDEIATVVKSIFAKLGFSSWVFLEVLLIQMTLTIVR